MRINASYKDIWKLAYPIIIGSFAQNFIGITDVIFLGRVGEVEFGAVGLISIYYLVMVMIGFGISRGGQILIARRVGENKYKEVGAITYNLFLLEMVVAFFLFFFLFFGSPLVLSLFIADQQIYDACLVYINYRAFSIFFSFFGFALMALYTGIGRTKIIAVVTSVLFITNVCLNYCLIFGYYGFPEMGIAGAGLASTIAEIVGAVVGIAYILKDKTLLAYDVLKKHVYDKDIVSRINRLSMPIVIQFVVGLGGWFLLFSLIESMGKRALSISTVLKYVYTFYSIPAWGFASAANALVSNIIGQKKYKQVYLAINRTAILSFIFTITPCLSLILFSDWILSVFTNDPEVIKGAEDILQVIIVTLLAGSISVVVFNGLVGTGATMLSLLIESASVVIYLIYAFAVVKVFFLGLGYVWGSELLYWMAMVVLTWGYMYTGHWKKMVV